MSFTRPPPNNGYKIDFVNKTIVDRYGGAVANLPSYETPEDEAADRLSWFWMAQAKILLKSWRVRIWRENFPADDARWNDVWSGSWDSDVMQVTVPGINPKESFALHVISPQLWTELYERYGKISAMTEEEVEAERVRLRRVGMLEDK